MIIPANRYYRTRVADTDYSDYWGSAVDPDGVERDRLKEKAQYIDDLAYDINFARVARPAYVLDVGCGPGWFLSAVAAENSYGTEVCDQAAEVARAAGVIVERDLDDIPGVFDLVNCHHVIEHVEDPERLLCQIRSKMDYDSWLILSTPDFGSPCANRFGERYRMLRDKTHKSLFTNESMFRMLRDYGFDIRDIRYPFADRFATADTWSRWTANGGVSPPWPGNWMSFYCKRGA